MTADVSAQTSAADQPARDQPAGWHLAGNHAPVPDEIYALDLEVIGALPPELDGLYLRNGANPASGASAHWFLGDGMLHAVRLEGGRATSYRNRWVRTRQLEGASMLGATGIDLTVSPANTSIVAHAGRLLALCESSLPTMVRPDLTTAGTYDYGGRLGTAMTAHPKRCPTTGELHFFGYGVLPPYLTYHVADAAGALVHSTEVPTPGATMMHDFALTASRVVFLDLPVVFSLDAAMAGTMPFGWSDSYGARIGLLDRGGSGADVRWYAVDRCYVFHTVNAYDDGAAVVLEGARYAELWRGGPADMSAPPRLHRWRIDPATGHVSEQVLDDRAVEFPRIDERRVGLPHRFAWTVRVDGNRGEILRYDLRSGGVATYDCGPGRVPGEAVFVPAGAGEDEGFVLAFVYDAARDGTDLVVIDATAPQSGPTAAVRMPRRVPFGFHGCWLDAADCAALAAH